MHRVLNLGLPIVLLHTIIQLALFHACQIVDKSDPTMDYHCTELDKDDEGVHR